MVNWQVESKPRNRRLWFVLGGCFTILLCLGFLSFSAVALVLLIGETKDTTLVQFEDRATEETSPESTLAPKATQPGPRNNALSQITATPSPEPLSLATPTATLAIVPPDEIDQRAASAQTFENLDRLFEASYPHQDYFDTAVRLGGYQFDARTVRAETYQLKDLQTFQVDGGRIRAELAVITDHIYFWVEEGLDLPEADLVAAAMRLEQDYYPRIVNLFGQEWQPGVDNDPHFSVLHLRGSTSDTDIGYFTSIDEFPRSLYAESNEQELIYLNMAQLQVGNDLYFGTLVHELQHLIQWYIDSNESTWLNEGLSQLAEIYVGLDSVDSEEYQRQPEIRLNTWSYDDAGPSETDAHYAASFLFSVYLWEQLGETAVQELSRHPANGLAAVRSVLQGFRPEMTLEQFIGDWIAANFLDDPAAGPRHYYRNLDLSRPSFEMQVDTLPFDAVRQLNQYGTHFIDLDFRGPVTMTFAADTIVELIDVPPHNGELMWFVPGVDDADAQLTATFDLSGLDRATLRFNTWYELEEDYDFAYVSVSRDNGGSWELLRPNHSTRGEFGPAFNGRSISEPDSEDGWLKESISLDNYVGAPLMVRFEVLTDYETDHLGTGRGFAIDDISIPELGYHSDVETPISAVGGTVAGMMVDGWVADGFVQTGWQLPQQWVLLLIEGGPQPVVTRLPLNHLNQVQLPIEVGKGGATLAVIPLTPFSDELASYWLQIER